MEIKFMFQIPNHQPGTVLLTYHKPDIQQHRKWLPLSFLAAGETAQIPTGRSILPGPTANWRFVKKWMTQATPQASRSLQVQRNPTIPAVKQVRFTL